MDLGDILNEIFIIGGRLTEDERNLVRDKFIERRAKDGEIIINEGEIGSSMFFIVDGEVKIFRGHLGRKIELAVLKSGNFFGEMALLDEFPRSASVSAIGDCILYELSKKNFNEIVENYPSLGLKITLTIANELSKRIRIANVRIEDMFFITEGLIENEKFREFYKHMFK
ncbi:MAG: cyclic nucleotide-binding domain-containing protein [bacterium]